MTVTIREYRSSDWSEVCRVHDGSRPLELLGSFDERAFVPLADDPECEYISACEMFIAERDDVVVGFAGIDDPYLAWLYVDPVYTRRGIGLALLKHCLARLGNDAWTIVCGNNTAALGLYMGEGFVVEKQFRGDNAGYEGPLARLALDPKQRGWTKPKRSDCQPGESQ